MASRNWRKVFKELPEPDYLIEHYGNITSLVFSPDSTMLASASKYPAIILWDTSTKAKIKSLQGDYEEFYSLSFSPDGQLLASTSRDESHYTVDTMIMYRVKLWNIENGQTEQTYTFTSDFIIGRGLGNPFISFNPNGNTIAGMAVRDKIEIWEIGKETNSKIIPTVTTNGYALAYNQEGTILAGPAENTKRTPVIRLWDVSSGEIIKDVETHKLGYNGLSFSPDGTQIISAGYDTEIKVTEIATATEVNIIKLGKNQIIGLAVSADGEIAAVGYKHPVNLNGKIQIRELATGKLLKTLESRYGQGGWGCCVAFSPDGHYLAGAIGAYILLWELGS